MQSSEFSCVIVTYNRIDSLSLLLSDINKQSQLPSVLFIVNNGSSLDIDLTCLGYKIIVLENKFNSLTIGRNLGLKNVITPFVFFLDDDIRLTTENYFSGMLYDFNVIGSCFGIQAYIKQDKPTFLRSLVFNFFFLYTLDNSCIVKPSVNVTYPQNTLNSKVINCEWLSGTNQLYKTVDLKSFSWDEKLFKYCDGEDLDFTFNLYRNKKDLFLTFNYEIIHSESLTSRLDSEELIFMREVYGYYIFNKYFIGQRHKLIFAWSRVGKLIIAFFNLVKNRDSQSLKGLNYLINALIFVAYYKNDFKNGDLTKFNIKFNYDV